MIDRIVQDHVFIDFSADYLFGDEQIDVTYPARFATVGFQLMSTNLLASLVDRIRKEEGYTPFYRYQHALLRKQNSTDAKILSLLRHENELAKQENSNKDPILNSTMRDYPYLQQGFSFPCPLSGELSSVGVRVSLFVSGCRNRCAGCFQPETWDFAFGKPFTAETENEIVKALRPSWIQGLSILGGEPMEPENQKALLLFLRRIRRELPDKDVWLYTRYRLESVSDSPLLPLVDVLVDGPYIAAEKDAGLVFRGSRNQRIIRLVKLSDRRSNEEVAHGI